MSGVDIVGALLTSALDAPAGLTSEQIKAGMLPEGIPLPALLVREVSSIERQPLRRGEKVRTIDRVAVLVRAASYREQKALIRWVRQVCRGQIGDIGGGSSVSILTAGAGPDLIGPSATFEQTQDLRVSYDAAG